jgi:hypothetical protein
MLKILAEYDTDTSPEKLTDISRHVLPCSSILGVSAGILQRSELDESGMTRTQI